jgi:hypothetical protein
MNFEFISDSEFRRSLNDDYREMMASADAGSWKAVHVLAGSIVEALLTEYLVASKIRPKGKDPLVLDLGEIIEACSTDGVLQKSTASLCDVIREFRNLIHPGRIIRLKQKVTPEAARIALNLVMLISSEVEERRKLNYGPTAEQIVSKLRTDEHCLSVFPELLADTKEHEKIRLVESVIPETVRLEESVFPEAALLRRLHIGYRHILEALPDAEQRHVAERFAHIVRSDSSERIQAYNDAFFSARDMRFLQGKDRTIVRKYLVNRLDQMTTNPSEEFFESLEGIGNYIEDDDIATFADTLIKLLLRAPATRLNQTEIFVHLEYDRVDNEVHKRKMEDRVLKWINTPRSRPLAPEAQKRLNTLSIQWSDIPF